METVSEPLVNDYQEINLLTESGLQNCNDDYIAELRSERSLFSTKSLFELSKSSWSPSGHSKENVQPYLRGCKWSPDGTCCLSVVNNDGVHVLELPRDLYDGDPSKDRPIDILNSVIHVREAGLIYDLSWFPVMNSSYPETCCWLTTRQNAPVQMWDAFNGSLRCTYRGYNSVDEMEPALSVTFTGDGSKIVAGCKKTLRTFETSRPGRDCSDHAIKSPASCLAVQNEILAVGSWNTSISLYNMSEMGTYRSIGTMHGHTGGVTHMKFTEDGLHLVSGARKDNKLLVWDIRYYKTPVNILSRIVNTNQRIYFDISPCGKYLVTGNTDGFLKVWDSEFYDWKSGITRSMDDHNLCEDGSLKFPLHYDCCNSVTMHPLRPILATGSGQYHFVDPEISIEQELPNKTNDDSNVTNLIENNMSATNPEAVNRNKKENIENSLVFWWTGVIPNLTN